MRDGTRLVSANIDGTIAVWNASTYKQLWRIDLDADSRSNDSHTISNTMGIAVSPDERLIAVPYDRDIVIGNTTLETSLDCLWKKQKKWLLKLTVHRLKPGPKKLARSLITCRRI